MDELLKEKALKFLVYKMRSEHEVRQHLKEKHSATNEAIEDIIDYLYSYNYLDDEKYAVAFIKDKLNFSPIGRIKMKYELAQKGINSSIIEIMIEELYPLEKEIEIAKKLLLKKGRASHSTQKNRTYLYSKGFSISSIEGLFKTYCD